MWYYISQTQKLLFIIIIIIIIIIMWKCQINENMFGAFLN